MAAAENHVMADAAAPPVISRTSAKLAGALSVGTSTPSANFALRTSTTRFTQIECTARGKRNSWEVQFVTNVGAAHHAPMRRHDA